MNAFQRSWLLALVMLPVNRVGWRAHRALWKRLTWDQKKMLIFTGVLYLRGNHHKNLYRLPWWGKLEMTHPFDTSRGFVPVCVLYWNTHIQHRADVVLTMKLWIECNEKYLGRRIGSMGIYRFFPDRYETPYVGIETPPNIRSGDNLLNV